MSRDPNDPNRDRAGDPYDDQVDDGYDDSSGGFFSPMSGWPGGGAAEEKRRDEYEGEVYDEEGTAGVADADESDDSWWDEGLISLLLVGGLVLFLFPEPATSAIGVLMMGAGVVAWLVDWAT